MSLMHFHSNETVLLDNNGIVAVIIAMVTAGLLWLRQGDRCKVEL
jgi:hypothetical protein